MTHGIQFLIYIYIDDLHESIKNSASHYLFTCQSAD